MINRLLLQLALSLLVRALEQPKSSLRTCQAQNPPQSSTDSDNERGGKAGKVAN